jgi:hypothetical protein
VNGVPQAYSADPNVEGISEWTHEKITAKYLGTTGMVYVRVGEISSNLMPFNKSSPELLRQDPYLPYEGGYRTIGETDEEVPQTNLTLAGCHFQSFASSLEITIGGVDCPIYPASLVQIPSVEGFCEGEGNKLRQVTCKVPEGTGEDNEIILKRGGNPNFTGNGTISLKYLPPRVDVYAPTEVETKGGSVLVTGDNFGDDISLVTVHMGWRQLEIDADSFSHTSMRVTVPPGEGTAKDIVVTVDGQVFVTSKDDDGVVRYFYPKIFTVEPDLLDTTGGQVELTGEYFGREGKASVSLVTEDEEALPYIVAVVEGTHDDMTINVGPGQGISQVAVNVSGNVAYSDLSYRPPSIDEPAGGAFVVPTNGGEQVRSERQEGRCLNMYAANPPLINAQVLIEGLNFGIGSDYKLEIRQKAQYEGAESIYDEEPGANSKHFPMRFFGEPDIVEITHTRLTMVSPAGQNERDDDLELVLRVAGQESNVIPFNFGRPHVVNMTMCFSDPLT